MRADLKKQLQNRLNRIRGQVTGLSRLIENDTYCIDIITQAQAIKSALSAVESLILKNHLETHVVEQMRGKNQQKAVEEILKVYKVSQKK
jgi:DNA-binding FrmR family transcriptional regulator